MRYLCPTTNFPRWSGDFFAETTVLVDPGYPAARGWQVGVRYGPAI